MGIYSYKSVREISTNQEGTKIVVIAGTVRKLKPVNHAVVQTHAPERLAVKRAVKAPRPKLVGAVKKVKTWTKRTPGRKTRTDWTRRGNAIKAEKGGVCYGPYISISACGKALGISKARLSKILRGLMQNKTGYTFTQL